MASVPAPAPQPDLQMVPLPRSGFREWMITGAGRAWIDPVQVLGAADEAGDSGVLRADAFLPIGDAGVPQWGPHPWAVTTVLGGADGPALGGVHVHVTSGVELTPIMLDGRPVGAYMDTEDGRECVLGDIRAAEATGSEADQARQMFENIERALEQAEMDFSHVARTWLFLDDILAWYDDLNVVRTKFFNDRKVFDGIVPASTGIGGANAAGTAAVASAIAIKPSSGEQVVTPLPSPLQCPALDYGSSFSRAVEVSLKDSRRVYVSGTASIEPGGKTAYVGDVVKQTERTADVVFAILESRGMDWGDVTRGTVYVRHAEDALVFDEYCAAKGLPRMPVVTAINVICRDDLLFEIEVDAVKAL